MVMQTKIGALRYDVIANTEKFKRSMVRTKQDFRDAKKVAQAAITPTERYQKELKRLNDLRRKGLISSQQYSAAVQKEAAALRKAGVEVRTMRQRFGESFRGRATSVGAGLIGTMIGGMTVGSIMEEVRAMDALAKTSRRLGIAANDLQTLRLAGDRMAGVGSQTVDMAMQRYTRRLAEAAKGQGELVKLFKQYNLSAKELQSMGTMESLGVIADLIKNTADDGERLRIAFKLFDSEGAQLVNMLRDGSGAIKEMDQQMRDLGLSVDNALLSKMEKANDQLAEMNDQWTALKREAAPTVAEGAGILSAMFKYRNDALKAIQQGQGRSGKLPLLGPLLPFAFLPGQNTDVRVDPFRLVKKPPKVQEEVSPASKVKPEGPADPNWFLPRMRNGTFGMPQSQGLFTDPIGNRLGEQRDRLRILEDRLRSQDAADAQREAERRSFTDTPDAGTRGSVAEYEALRQIVVGREEAKLAAAQKARDEQAQTTRKAIVTAIEGTTKAIKELEVERANELKGI